MVIHSGKVSNIMRILSIRKFIFLLAIAVISTQLFGCSGGGGGSATPDTLTYSGNTNAVVITKDNAKTLIANVADEDDAAIILAATGITIDDSTKSGASLKSALNLAKQVIKNLEDRVLIQTPLVSAIDVNDTLPCDNPDGSIIFTGQINDDGTGNLNVTFLNCLDGDVILDGKTIVQVDAFDFGLMILVDSTYTFTLITAQAPGYNVSMSGTMRDQVSTVTNTEQITFNLVLQDHVTNHMYKYENFIDVTQFDNLLYPATYTMTNTGRVYDSVEGYIDVTTDAALYYSNMFTEYPESGGPLKLTGANNSKIRITPVSMTQVMVELDLDGNSIYDSLTIMPWAMLTEVVVTNIVPVANAGKDQVMQKNTTATMKGSGTDGDGDFLSYQWELTSLPIGSVALLSNTATPYASFVADSQGDYVLTLTVSDEETTNSDTVTVTVTPSIAPLLYDVVDAEYSQQLNKVIMVSASPSQLHIYDPATQTETAVDLIRAPTSVSVSPDGLYAAVGHDALLSYVNLSNGSVEATHAVSTNILDIVLAGNGYAYAFPKTDQWEYIRCINITTGIETLHTGMQIYAGTVAKLQPGSTSIYGADNGLSPSDIEKYSITGGTAVYLYDSPYHGTYNMCGNIWIAETGDRIFTACGNIFNATNDQLTDMTYSGSLSGVTLIEHLNHSSSANQVALIPDIPWDSVAMDEDTEFLVYDPTSLSLSGRASFPSFIETDGAYASHGKFIFFIDNGNRYFVIVEEDAAAPNSSFGVLIYDAL